MISFAEKIAALEAEGYANAPARAKLAHDIVLKAMEACGFAKNITVKGGVVMSGITGDIRRANEGLSPLYNAKSHIDTVIKFASFHAFGLRHHVLQGGNLYPVNEICRRIDRIGADVV